MTATAEVSTDARDFAWLLTKFAQETAGVTEAIAVSSDGLLLANSQGPDRPNVDQICAIVSGLSSLTTGAARALNSERVEQVIVEMNDRFLMVARISDGSSLGVIADRDCEIGLVGYHMTLLVNRSGDLLTPELVAELKHSLV